MPGNLPFLKVSFKKGEKKESPGSWEAPNE